MTAIKFTVLHILCFLTFIAYAQNEDSLVNEILQKPVLGLTLCKCKDTSLYSISYSFGDALFSTIALDSNNDTCANNFLLARLDELAEVYFYQKKVIVIVPDHSSFNFGRSWVEAKGELTYIYLPIIEFESPPAKHFNRKVSTLLKKL